MQNYFILIFDKSFEFSPQFRICFQFWCTIVLIYECVHDNALILSSFQLHRAVAWPMSKLFEHIFRTEIFFQFLFGATNMVISGCRFDTLRFDFRLLFLQISSFSEVKICYFQIILQFVKYFSCAINRLLWNKTLPYNFAQSLLFSFWTNHLNFHNNVALVNARQYLLSSFESTVSRSCFHTIQISRAKFQFLFYFYGYYACASSHIAGVCVNNVQSLQRYTEISSFMPYFVFKINYFVFSPPSFTFTLSKTMCNILIYEIFSLCNYLYVLKQKLGCLILHKINFIFVLGKPFEPAQQFRHLFTVLERNCCFYTV